MCTANTMSSAIEAMGVKPALLIHDGGRRRGEGGERGRISKSARESAGGRTLLPRQLLTKAAFENAISVVMAVGGSTNAVLHSARYRSCAAEVELTLTTSERIREADSAVLRSFQTVEASMLQRTCTQSRWDPASCEDCCFNQWTTCMATRLTVTGETIARVLANVTR